METTPKQQAIELINQSKRILLVPSGLDGDSLGSTLGLFRVLKKMGKQVSAVSLETAPAAYRFLPHVSDLQTSLDGGRDFVITLNNPEVETDKLSYNFDGGKLNIIISTKKGLFQAENVEVAAGTLNYDLIITLDTATPDQLGALYTQNPDLFKEVPVVNIDHHATNSYFGQVNLVNMTAASTTEILVGIIEALGPDLLDEDVATCLLTGLIADTGSFQHPNTTPKALTVAAQMVGYGARQQEIVKNLYKTKSISQLKLWGRVLSQVKSDPQHRVVWGVASLADLSETGAMAQDFSGLVDEFLASVSDTDVAILISERETGLVHGSIRTQGEAEANEIAKLFDGGGHVKAAAFKITGMTLAQATEEIIKNVKTYQAQRLNLASQINNQQKPTPIPENTLG